MSRERVKRTASFLALAGSLYLAFLTFPLPALAQSLSCAEVPTQPRCLPSNEVVFEDIIRHNYPNKGAEVTQPQPVKTGISKARRASGYLPKLRVLGTIVLVGTAFEVGWKVGTITETKWLNFFGPGLGTNDGANPEIGVIEWTWHDSFTLNSVDHGEGWYLHILSNCVDWGTTQPGRSVFWMNETGYDWTPTGQGCIRTVAETAYEYITAPFDLTLNSLPDEAEFIAVTPCNGSGGMGGTWTNAGQCGAVKLSEEVMEDTVTTEEFDDWVAQTPTHTTTGHTSTFDAQAANDALDEEDQAGTYVNIEIDPDYTLAIPEPLAHEHYDAYVARLQSLGFVGTITRSDLVVPETYDPERGPSEAVYTNPTTGTQVAPDAAITVHTNPETAPPVDEGGTCDCPPVDFSPLTDAGFSENFPFGVFTWMADTLDSMNAAMVTPHIEFEMGGFSEHLEGMSFDVTLSFLDEYMGWIRTMLSFVLWAGGVWYVGAKLLKVDYAGDPTDAIDEAYNL